jgi:hypothetical protein
MRRSIAASTFVLILGPIFALMPIANASSPDASSAAGGGFAAPKVSSSGGAKYAFDTSEGRFTHGVDNQGWYQISPRSGGNRNDNYIVGKCCGGTGEYRDFFTFDLSSLDERAVSATLVLTDPKSHGGAVETIRFSAVDTPARRLNHNDAGDRTIYSDLGHGQLYGEFGVLTDHRRQTRRFRLNERAVAAINQARGSYFSVGGRLLHLSDGPSGEHLFGFSGTRGVQTLIIRTSRD